jgi:hypothetical protein
MLEIGRLTQDLVNFFEPPGRWMFVKLVVIAFTGAAIVRLLPWRARHTVMKRSPRGAVAVQVCVAVATVAGLAGAVVVAAQADHQYTALRRGQLIAFLNRPAHASLAAAEDSYFGVYEPDAPSSYRQVTQFAAATHSRPRMALYYSNWNEPFQTSFAETAYANGAVTAVQIMPMTVKLSAIVKGTYDRYVTRYAEAVRDFRHPVVISFAPEMNGNWYPWGYLNSSPASWVGAWRHIVDVFRAHGADNVCWLWAANMIYPGDGPLREYWPGSKYVTWAGIDAYFVPQKHRFKEVVNPTLREIRTITPDPVIISETGIAPQAGKVATLGALFSGVKADHLLGFIYFDGNQPQGANYHYRWRLEDSATAVAAYARLVGKAGAGTVYSTTSGKG